LVLLLWLWIVLLGLWIMLLWLWGLLGLWVVLPGLLVSLTGLLLRRAWIVFVLSHTVSYRPGQLADRVELGSASQ